MNLSPIDIDAIINSKYSGISPLTELGQLGILFSPGFIKDFMNICHDSSVASYPNNALVNLEVNFGWIDKIPLAKFYGHQYDHNNNRITGKVEIGDIFFSFKDKILNSFNPQASTATKDMAYSFVLQAKRSPSIKLPKVPVTYSGGVNSSTAKEYHLLSKWPRFDLYKTSGNNTALHNNLQINNPSNVLNYGWYAACPPTNNLNNLWRSRWMCSPAILGNECNITLGTVLAGFFNRIKVSGIEIGNNFTLLDDWEVQKKSHNLDSWSILSNEIINICNEMLMPKVVNVKSNRLIKIDIVFIRIIQKLSLLYHTEVQLLKSVLKRIIGERYLLDEELERLFNFLQGEGFSNQDVRRFVGMVFDGDAGFYIYPLLRDDRRKGDDFTIQELKSILSGYYLYSKINKGVKNNLNGCFVLNISRTIYLSERFD